MRPDQTPAVPPLDMVLGRFPDAKQHGATWRARCPAHGGDNPTALSISEGEDGTVLLWCHAHGCTAEAITSSVGLTLADLFPSSHPRRHGLRLIKPKRPPKQTDAEKILISMVASEIMGLLWGPLPERTLEPEAAAQYTGLLETLWDVYAEHSSHEAVLGAWLNMRASLTAQAPKLLAAIDRRCQDMGKEGYNTPPRPPLATYRASDLQRKEFPTRQWVVDEVISEGVMLLAGPSGLGKSFFALQLALAVAHGGKAFSGFDVERGEVLYCSFEDDERSMQERLDTLEEGATWPEDLHILHTAPRLDQGLATDLEAWLKAHTRARLIIIDVLKHIRPPRQSKGDWYEQDYAVVEALKPLASAYHVAIVLLHHTNKLARPEDPLDAISGSTGLVGPADIKAVFARGRGAADAKLFLTGRSVRERWLAFEFRECVWTYLGPAQAVERTKTRQAIIAAMSGQGAMTAKAIAAAVHDATQGAINASLVRYTLRQMLGADELRQPERGWYAVPLTTDSQASQPSQSLQASQSSQQDSQPNTHTTVVRETPEVVRVVSPDVHTTHNREPAPTAAPREFVSLVSPVRAVGTSRCECGYPWANNQRVCFQCHRPREASVGD